MANKRAANTGSLSFRLPKGEKVTLTLYGWEFNSPQLDAEVADFMSGVKGADFKLVGTFTPIGEQPQSKPRPEGRHIILED